MGSHSVTCHPTEVRIPPLPTAKAGTRFSDPGGMQGWVDLCYVKATGRELNPWPENRKSNALPLSHHATQIVSYIHGVCHESSASRCNCHVWFIAVCMHFFKSQKLSWMAFLHFKLSSCRKMFSTTSQMLLTNQNCGVVNKMWSILSIDVMHMSVMTNRLAFFPHFISHSIIVEDGLCLWYR